MKGDAFAQVLALYEEGRCLDAWEAGKTQGELGDWPPVEPRLLGCRLASHLGAPRLSNRLVTAAFRSHPTNPYAQYYRVSRVWERRGALAAWQERRRLGPPPPGDPTAVADYHGQCCLILGVLRDFDAAEWHVARAREAEPGRRYWYAERASLSQDEDRYDDALRVAREGLSRYPNYPPNILAAARSLHFLDRHAEALELLQSAAQQTQSSHVVGYMVGLLVKGRLLDAASAALSRYEELTPLKEEGPRNFIAATRADIALLRGDYRAAMPLVEQVKNPFYVRVADNLRAFLADPAAPPPRQVELGVPFVRQHHMTCAPATLSAISQFWNRPAAHLEVAEEICYDGTPHHSERRWARDNGWRATEFRVDWDSAIALLDHRIPFTLTTADPTSGHLQAVIGYDHARGLLLARDPTFPDTVEISARELFAEQRANGPRGMAMVPAEQGSILDDLKLPESSLYDAYHELDLALERHDREGAVVAHARMVAEDPRHRLTLTGRRALAAYDENAHEGLAAADALLEQYPDDQALQLFRLSGLRLLATRDDRLAWLQTVCDRPGADPLLWIEYAVELMIDERMARRALHLVKRALRRRPDDAYGVLQLARLTWTLGPRGDAIELYRFAACLNVTREAYAEDYFNACRWLNQTEAGLTFLRARAERLGARSGFPAMTLFNALETLDRTGEAFAVLEAAVARRPDDGDLRLYAAGRFAAYGRVEEAAGQLAAAGGTRRPALLAEEARMARLAGNRPRALELWREILQSRPLDLEAHRAIALLLAEMGEPDAAVDHLRTYTDKFPHNAALQQLLYEWTEGRPAGEREQVLRTLLAIDPVNAWTVRELAINLCGQDRMDEAIRLADEAVALDATGAISHTVRGYVLHVAGRSAESADSYRTAIARSAGTADAIHGLLDTAAESAAATAGMAFIEARLLEQAVVGDGVSAFRAAARGLVPPAELLPPLQRLHAARPDLWQTWSALANHLADMGNTDEALGIARDATARFAYVPRVWLDLSQVHRARHELDDEIAALRRCREINPEWKDGVSELAAALVRAGRLEESEDTLEAAIRLTPLAAELRGHLASVVRQRGDTDRAIVILQEALRIAPDYSWAWEALTEWSQAQGRASSAIDLALALAESRHGESHPWCRLADLRHQVGRFDDALDALERALRINPRGVAALDLKALVLAEQRRFAEAEATCRPPGIDSSHVLQGRAAWVNARRGDLTTAIGRMRDLVRAHPAYAWGWSRLVEWLAQRDDVRDAIFAAERLAWLRPHDALPLKWIGDLKLRRGDRDGAVETFRRAMRLQPDDVYAGFQLFQIQRQDLDFEGMRRTLDILGPFAGRDELLAAEAELAAARTDLEGYLEVVRELCRRPTDAGAAASRAIEAAVRPDWRKALERTLDEQLRLPGWNPVVPVLWVRVRALRHRLGSPFAFKRLAGLGEPGKHAAVEALAQIAEVAKRNRANLFTRAHVAQQLLWIRHYGREWWGDDLFWGQYGYALTCLAASRWAVRWMRDWRGRSNLEPWMMQNRISSLLTLHRRDAAVEALHWVARAMAPRVDIGPLLTLWCAVGACLDNDLELAEQLLHHAPQDVLTDDSRAAHDLATALLAICRDPSAPASLTSQRALHLDRAMTDMLRFSDSGYLARLAALHAAQHVRHPWKTLKAWMALHRPRTILVILGAYFMLRVLMRP